MQSRAGIWSNIEGKGDRWKRRQRCQDLSCFQLPIGHLQAQAKSQHFSKGGLQVPVIIGAWASWVSVVLFMGTYWSWIKASGLHLPFVPVVVPDDLKAHSKILFSFLLLHSCVSPRHLPFKVIVKRKYTSHIVGTGETLFISFGFVSLANRSQRAGFSVWLQPLCLWVIRATTWKDWMRIKEWNKTMHMGLHQQSFTSFYLYPSKNRKHNMVEFWKE